MSTSELDERDTHPGTAGVDSRWPLGGLAGAGAGLIRPVGVVVLAAAGVPVGLFAPTVQPELPLWHVIHLGYSVAFGVAYVGIAYRGTLRPYVGAPATGALVGGAYGVALWVVNVAVFWNLLQRLAMPTGAVQGSLAGPLVGHVVYGVALGVLYPIARRFA